MGRRTKFRETHVAGETIGPPIVPTGTARRRRTPILDIPIVQPAAPEPEPEPDPTGSWATGSAEDPETIEAASDEPTTTRRRKKKKTKSGD